MAQGLGYHRTARANLEAAVAEEGRSIPIVSSAGALVEGLKARGVRRVSLLMPYMKPLAARVVEYVESEGIEVHDSLALEIEDNLAVAARDPLALVDDVDRLDVRGVDAVVLSACVQMPSLAALDVVEDKLGLPGHLGGGLHGARDARGARSRARRARGRGDAARDVLGARAHRMSRARSPPDPVRPNRIGPNPVHPQPVRPNPVHSQPAHPPPTTPGETPCPHRTDPCRACSPRASSPARSAPAPPTPRRSACSRPGTSATRARP